MKNYFVGFVQLITYLLISIPIRVIYSVKRNGNLIIKKDKKYILAANHPSMLDPFLILASLPLKSFIRLIPLRFVTADNYLKKWYHRMFLIPLGCISTKRTDKRKSLEIYEERLNKGETIFIFPRGILEKRNRPLKLHVGAIYLEKKVNNSYIIPTKITINDNISIRNILLRRVNVTIEFKKPFRHKKFKEDFLIHVKDLMELIEKDGQ